MDSGILVSNAIVGGTSSSSTCVGDMVVNLDLISSSPFTAPVMPMYNSPVGLNSGGIGEPRVSPVSRASPIVNPCPSGNIVDLLEQVTVPHRDHLPPCATTSPTAGQNNDGAGRLQQMAGSSWSTIVSGGAGGATPPAVDRMKFEYIPPYYFE